MARAPAASNSNRSTSVPSVIRNTVLAGDDAEAVRRNGIAAVPYLQAVRARAGHPEQDVVQAERALADGGAGLVAQGDLGGAHTHRHGVYLSTCCCVRNARD